MLKIPIEISARHAHLCKTDLEQLFGKGYELEKFKGLTQPSDFAANETVDIKHHSKVLKNLRVVGPLRDKTQVELSKTDAIYIEVPANVRLSGNLVDTPGITLIGPEGQVELDEGVIVAKRHLHANPFEAADLGIKHGQEISIRVEGERGIVFEKVAVRVRDDYRLCLHLDTDEGNAAGINKIGQGQIIK